MCLVLFNVQTADIQERILTAKNFHSTKGKLSPVRSQGETVSERETRDETLLVQRLVLYMYVMCDNF